MTTRADPFLSDGFTLLARTQFDDAANAFRQAAMVEPSNAIALYGLGFSRVRQSRWQDGFRCLSNASQSIGTGMSARVLTEIHLARGLCQRNLGSPEAGAASYRRAVIAEPSRPQGYFNLTNVLTDRDTVTPVTTGHAKRAAAFATITEPRSGKNWNTLARVLATLDTLEPSEQCFRRAVVLDPAHEHAWDNIGILHKRRDAVDDALACFRRANQIQPENPEVLANLGRNQLLTGDFVHGWTSLEAPWRARGFAPRNDTFRLPTWDGSSLKGARLLVWSEEKIGEEIMFSTMLDDVRVRAGPITLLCNPRIETLLATAMPEVEVLGWDGTGLPPVDLAAFGAGYPLEYLGRFVRRCFADFPPPTRFLKASRGPDRHPARSIPTVGIHWTSINPLVGAYKSIPLADWASILAIPGVDFVSLQYGAVEKEIAAVRRLTGFGPRVPERIDQLVDVQGFADFVASLDLVISISGTTAHISGGLGVPTWLLLPAGPGLSWYWFQRRLDSPWYPNCKLYRQPNVRAWAPVIARVERDLVAWRDHRRAVMDRQTTSSR